MKTPRTLVFAGCAPLAVILLAACASDANPNPSVASPAPAASQPLANSPAEAAVAKLVKNLTSAQVRALLGSPTGIKPLKTDGAKAENWSYAFSGATHTRVVPIATQEIPATNPLTGQSITRTEPIYQNQDLQTIDTLHLLLIDDRLIEWRVIRDEKKKFQ